METDRGLDLLEVASRCFEPESYRIRQGLRAILKYKIQYPTLTPRVEVLPYAVNYNGNEFSNPNPQGQRTPRCYKSRWNMNSPNLTPRFGEVPYAATLY